MGRETELNAIATLIDSTDCRLISLVGIGGSGKTRLAIQAAGQCRSFPHGVYFIALEAVETQDDMVHAIAGALKLDFQAATGAFPSPSYALNQLCAFFSGKKFLLVLDNFEHLINTASLVSDLLEHNSGLHLIVTSRERLNLPGEWVIEVGGLAFPGQVDLTHIQDYVAVQLFLKSAERSGGFTSGGEMPADAGDTQAIAGE